MELVFAINCRWQQRCPACRSGLKGSFQREVHIPGNCGSCSRFELMAFISGGDAAWLMVTSIGHYS